jgi:membrane associated rhomboid family serine protease
MTDAGRSLGESPTVQTLVAFAVVFVLQALLTAIDPDLLGLFVLSPPVTAQPWTLVTSIYAHAGPAHLVGNAIALVLFGVALGRATTALAYYAYFVVTGVLAGLAQVYVAPVVYAVWTLLGLDALTGVVVGAPFGTGAIGASGAIFAVAGYVLAGNRLSRGVFDRLGLGLRAQLLVFGVVAVALTYYTAAPGVAVVAHFAGLFVGLVAGRAGVLPTRSGAGGGDSTSYKTDYR